MEEIIKLKNLSVFYGEEEVVKDVNLSFKKNKVTALIGHSGCGKTTILKTMNQLIAEEKNARVKGKVIFKEQSIDKMDVETLRKTIGIVFQNPTPFPFSIEKNMLYPLDYHGGYGKKEKQQMIQEKLEKTGLYEEVKDRMNFSAQKLSGGQQQRLCMARSLTLNPEVLLLDEPCSSLDPKSTKKIEQTLKDLSENITVIIVTHNMAQARRIADYVAFFSEGRLIEYGETEKVFQYPKKEETKQYVEGLLV